jgi:hypothetical protein
MSTFITGLPYVKSHTGYKEHISVWGLYFLAYDHFKYKNNFVCKNKWNVSVNNKSPWRPITQVNIICSTIKLICVYVFFHTEFKYIIINALSLRVFVC